MAGKIVILANHKGGVGKTTLSQTLGLGMAHKGYRVVLVDADGQATLTQYALGMNPEPGFYDFVVRDDASFQELARPIWASEDKQSWCVLLPGNGETRHIASSVSDPHLIRNRFEPILETVDLIVIDPSPTESMLHPLTYVASDFVLHPTICEDWSIGSLQKTMQYVKATQPYRTGMNLPPIVTLGIVPTMYQSNTITHTEIMSYLTQEYKELVWNPIGRRIAWSEAASYQKPVFEFMPKSDAADEAWGFINRVEQLVMGVKDVQQA